MAPLLCRFLPILVLILPAMAHAQSVKQSPTFVLTNCNAAALDSPIASCEVKSTSAGVSSVAGWNLLTLELLYTDHAGGEGTGYSFLLQACSEGIASTDCTDAADWYSVATDATSAGTVTLTPGTFTRAATATDRLTWSTTINYVRLRLATITGLGSPVATDTITVRARLAVTPAH